MRRLNFKKIDLSAQSGIIVFFVIILNKCVALLTQPFINRILSQEQVGTFSVFQSWQSIFSIIATFNLFGGILEVQITKKQENKKEIVASLLSLSALIWLVFFSIIICIQTSLSVWLELNRKYILYMCFLILADMIVEFWMVTKRFTYSYRDFAIVSITLFLSKSVLSVILSYVMVSDRVAGRILGLLIPTSIFAIVLLFMQLSNCKHTRLNYLWAVALRFNLPLIPHYLSSVALASSDRIMISVLSSKENAGMYSVAYLYSGLGYIVFSAINSAYSPYAMSEIKNKKEDGKLSEVTDTVVIISILFAILLIMMAPEGLLIIGGEEYLSTLSYVPILVVGIFLSSFYYIFSNVEFVFEKTRLICPITIIGALTNIVLNYYFIPIAGYDIASYTTFISYLIITICHYIYYKKITDVNYFRMKRIVISVLSLSVLGFVGRYVYRLSLAYRILISTVIVMSTIIYLWNSGLGRTIKNIRKKG